MTDLKTLKDIPADYESLESENIKDEIRQEAIKWVKAWKKNAKYGDENRFGRIDGLMQFFNLTEEDISNG